MLVESDGESDEKGDLESDIDEEELINVIDITPH